MKKRWRVVFLMTLCLALVFGVSAGAGFRRMANGKYRYYISKNKYLSGTKGTQDYRQWTFRTIGAKKRYTYCFDGDGYMVTGWQHLTTKAANGAYYWYYFDRNGRMLKNRTKNGHYLQKNGRMLTNQWHNNVYYGADGAAIPGYRADVRGGFRRTKKGTKYLQPDGTYAMKKWVCIQDSTGQRYWYYFYSTGYMAKKKWVGNHYVDAYGRLVVGKTKTS